MHAVVTCRLFIDAYEKGVEFKKVKKIRDIGNT